MARREACTGGDHSGVDTDRFPLACQVNDPFLPCGDFQESDFHQVPVQVELFCGLVEVSSVSEQGGLVMRDDCRASRSGES